MKIQLVSDLHLNHFKDYGERLISSMYEPVDVLILAGDIYEKSASRGPHMRDTLQMICDKYSGTEIIYVMGNHEPYGVGIEETHDMIRRISDSNPNLHWLENRVITIGGIDFAGCTMWFRRNESAPTKGMSDFYRIHDIKHAHNCNDESMEFLDSVVNDNTIVVTHHAPSYLSVSKEFIGSDLNPWFVCDMEQLIGDKNPMYWFHGHMHNIVSYFIGNTEVICEPHGYINYEIFHDESMKYKGRIFEIIT